MVHRKEEYDPSGHHVTILQVNENGSIGTWIDGWAGHAHEAMERVPIDVDQSDEWRAIKQTLAYMVDNDLYFCNRCKSFYDSDNVVGAGFAGHICKSCDIEKKTCPDNPNGDSHEDVCLNPGQKRNARVPTKYKCEHCGRVRKTTPTG